MTGPKREYPQIKFDSFNLENGLMHPWKLLERFRSAYIDCSLSFDVVRRIAVGRGLDAIWFRLDAELFGERRNAGSEDVRYAMKSLWRHLQNIR